MTFPRADRLAKELTADIKNKKTLFFLVESKDFSMIRPSAVPTLQKKFAITTDTTIII